MLDEATGRWGLRVARVELRSIDPPPSIQDSMEKQMRADREKRAMILTAEGSREASIKQAEGQKQAQILAAEGAKQAAILAAEADRQSRILRAQGERAAQYLQAQGQAKAIEKTFAAIKAGRPTPNCWPTSTCRPCRRWPRAQANKVWVVPSDFGSACRVSPSCSAPPATTACSAISPRRSRRTCPSPGRQQRGRRLVHHQTDPAIAQAVAKAEAEARSPVPTGITPSYSTPQYPPLSQQTQPSATDSCSSRAPPGRFSPHPGIGANEADQPVTAGRPSGSVTAAACRRR